MQKWAGTRKEFQEMKPTQLSDYLMPNFPGARKLKK